MIAPIGCDRELHHTFTHALAKCRCALGHLSGPMRAWAEILLGAVYPVLGLFVLGVINLLWRVDGRVEILQDAARLFGLAINHQVIAAITSEHTLRACHCHLCWPVGQQDGLGV